MPSIRLGFVLLFVGPMVASLYYGGLLSLTVAFFVNQILNNAPLTLAAVDAVRAGGAGRNALVSDSPRSASTVARRSAALRTTPPARLTRLDPVAI